MADNPPPVAQSQDDNDVEKFRKQVMRGEWEEVIQKYQNNIYYHRIEIVGKGTALHMAANAELKDQVSRLVEAIIQSGDNSSLVIINEIGATPLHLAAYRGFTDVCQLIIGTKGERKKLIKVRNNDGETPLFWAVCGYKTLVFLYLQQFYPTNLNMVIDKNRRSILHVAIEREMFDLAFIIMHFYHSLKSKKNKDGIIPLEILATRTSAFKSGSRLPWWKQILYYCVTISQDDAKNILDFYIKEDKHKENENHDKTHHSQVDIHEDPVNVTDLEKTHNIKTQKSKSRQPTLPVLDEIETIKKKHTYGKLLFQKFMEEPLESYMDSGDNPGSHTEYDNGITFEAPNFDLYTESQRKKGDTSTPETNKNKKIEDSENIDGKDTTFLAVVKSGIVELEIMKGATSTQETNKNKKIEDSENIDGKDTAFLAVVKSGIVEIMKGLNSKVPITSDNKGLLLVAMNNIKTKAKSPVKDTAYLIAASNGITEMMVELQSKILGGYLVLPCK